MTRKLTNLAGLPQALVDAVANDSYTKGSADISITNLLKPPRMVELERQHEDDITEDASDRIWSLLGQATHTILERANRTAIAERRLSIEIQGWKVSGGMDLYQEEIGTLIDYKVTSAWKVSKGEFDDWIHQLNMYAVMLRHHGHKVEKLQIVAILRDWSKMEAQRSPDYIQSQVCVIDIPVWDNNKALSYMTDRVILHQQARITLPRCSDTDKWSRPTMWAVMKKGQKRAVKLHSTEEEATNHAKWDTNLSVEKRKGIDTRCQSYCSVAKFCSQFKNEE